MAEAGAGELHLHYLNHPDVEALALSDGEIVAAVEQALVAQGRGETTIEPRMHLKPEKDGSGHFNVLRGYVRPLGLAGVKVVGDFCRNYEVGLPSELALLNLFDPTTGVPIADHRRDRHHRHAHGRGHGDRRARARARKRLARCSATSVRAARRTGTFGCCDSIFAFDEIRVHSRRPESRDAFGARLRRDLGRPNVVVTEDWESCVRGADIVVEASRLAKPEPMLKTEWIEKGALRHSLRDDERRGALAHRHHGQDRHGRLGPSESGCRTARCARTSTATGSRRTTCMPSSARSSRG